jgi:hypothetical protein
LGIVIVSPLSSFNFLVPYAMSWLVRAVSKVYEVIQLCWWQLDELVGVFLLQSSVHIPWHVFVRA